MVVVSRMLTILNNTMSAPLPSSLGLLTGLAYVVAGAVGCVVICIAPLDKIAVSRPHFDSVTSSRRVLDLRNCSIPGTIPDAVSSLLSMSVLYLANNALTGSIPAAISGMTRLTSVSRFYSHPLILEIDSLPTYFQVPTFSSRCSESF